MSVGDWVDARAAMSRAIDLLFHLPGMEFSTPADQALVRAELLGFLEIDLSTVALNRANRSTGGLPVEIAWAMSCQESGRVPLFVGRFRDDHFVAAIGVRPSLIDAFIERFVEILEQQPVLKPGPAIHSMGLPRPIAVTLASALAAVDAKDRGVAPTTLI